MLTKLFEKFKILAIATLGTALLKLIAFTYRWQKMEMPINEQLPPGARILLFWHNRLLIVPFFYTHFREPLQIRIIKALTSAHKDGRIISKVMEFFGVGSVQGSSSRRGAAALVELRKIIRLGGTAVITPDGPRGPKYVVKEGIVKLASITGAPLFLITVSANSAWEFGSWDSLLLAKPFAKLVGIVSKPIYVPQELTAEQFELQRQHIEAEMQKLTLRGEELVGNSGVGIEVQQLKSATQE